MPAALNAKSYKAACDASEKQCSKRLPRQTYAILPKIREVDTVLRSSANLRERVVEVHPEVSFCFWNGKQFMEHPKRSGFGFLERLDLAREEFGDAANRIRQQVTRAAVFEDPVRANVPLTDIEKLLRALGAELSEGRGSRVRIYLNGVRAVFHRPHPRKEMDKGALRSMRRFLLEAGVAREE